MEFATVEDGSGNVLDTTYYRYYTSNSSTGYIHGLESVFRPDFYARLTAALGTSVDSLTDSQVLQYADNFFQYDSSHRVTEEIAAGAGSCVLPASVQEVSLPPRRAAWSGGHWEDARRVG
jgi:hypothetical protein